MVANKEGKIDMTVRCETCHGFKHPRKKMEYPNSDGKKQWVICEAGNCINNRTRGCQLHSSGELELMPELKTELKVKPQPKEEISELLGGVDFDGLLKDEINKIGAKA